MELDPGEQLPDSQESFNDIWSQIDLGATMQQILKDCENAVPAQQQQLPTVSTPVIKQEAIIEPPQSVNTYKAPFLCMEKYLGPHGFDIKFPVVASPVAKCTPHTYSNDIKKWFVKMGSTCPMNFVCTTLPPIGSVVRAVPVYNQAENMMDIVTRCLTHKLQDKTAHQAASHLIRASMPDEMVSYSSALNGRENVTVSYQSTDNGNNNAVILYQFMCNSSCSGINRKPVSLVLTLETDNGDVLGRCVVDIHISSCPGRDRGIEEDKVKSTGSKTQVTKKKPVSKRKREIPKSEEDDVFYLEIKGRDKYEFLKKMKTALDLEDYVAPEVKEKYYAEERNTQL